ncbi:hypothetical protein NQ315_011348, partial [Exocentrus adspersus]
MATSKSAGSVCAAKMCKSRSYVMPGLSFFTFPKDVARARIWVIACQREDLLERINTLHRNYKLCELHFEVKMVNKNYLRKTLVSNAVPTRFPQLEGTSRTSTANVSVFDHSYTPFAVPPLLEPPKKIRILQNIILTPGSTEGSATDMTTSELELTPYSPLAVKIVDTSTDPELLSPTSSTQTPSSLSAGTPRKRKFMARIKTLKDENKSLKRKIEVLEAEARNKNYTFDDYQSVTKKMCISPEIATFINTQVSQIHKKPRGRRYSKDFKIACLE